MNVLNDVYQARILDWILVIAPVISFAALDRVIADIIAALYSVIDVSLYDTQTTAIAEFFLELVYIGHYIVSAADSFTGVESVSTEVHSAGCWGARSTNFQRVFSFYVSSKIIITIREDEKSL